jgi:hypothetical protein
MKDFQAPKEISSLPKLFETGNFLAVPFLGGHFCLSGYKGFD